MRREIKDAYGDSIVVDSGAVWLRSRHLYLEVLSDLEDYAFTVEQARELVDALNEAIEAIVEAPNETTEELG